jgi:hypothetical protein
VGDQVYRQTQVNGGCGGGGGSAGAVGEAQGEEDARGLNGARRWGSCWADERDMTYLQNSRCFSDDRRSLAKGIAREERRGIDLGAFRPFGARSNRFDVLRCRKLLSPPNGRAGVEEKFRPDVQTIRSIPYTDRGKTTNLPLGRWDSVGDGSCLARSWPVESGDDFPSDRRRCSLLCRRCQRPRRLALERERERGREREKIEALSSSLGE